MNNNFSSIPNRNLHQGQNMNLLRSTPNYSNLRYNKEEILSKVKSFFTNK